MTASGEEGAAAILLAGVPTELAVPRADAVVVVDFAVMETAEEPLVEEGLRHAELAREPALEADTSLHAMLRRRGDDVADLFRRVRHRLLEDDVLAGGCGSHGLIPMLAGIARDVDDIDLLVGEEILELPVGLHRPAMLGGELGGIEGPRRADRGHLPLSGGIDGVDVRRCRPAIADHTDISRLHQSPPVARRPPIDPPHPGRALARDFPITPHASRSVPARFRSAHPWWSTKPSIASYSGNPSLS